MNNPNPAIPISPKLQRAIDQIRGERVPRRAPYNDNRQTAEAIAEMKAERRAAEHAENVELARKIAALSDDAQESLANALLDGVAARRPTFERSLARGLRRGGAPIEKRAR